MNGTWAGGIGPTLDVAAVLLALALLGFFLGLLVKGLLDCIASWWRHRRADKQGWASFRELQEYERTRTKNQEYGRHVKGGS